MLAAQSATSTQVNSVNWHRLTSYSTDIILENVTNLKQALFVSRVFISLNMCSILPTEEQM